MKRLMQSVTLFLLLALSCRIPVSAYPVVYSEDFESFDTVMSRFGDTVAYKLRPDTFGTCAFIESTDSTQSRAVADSLPLDSLRGSRVILTAWAKLSDMSLPPESWNGVKVMLIIRKSDGLTDYPQIPWPDTASFGWTRALLPVTIPANAVSVRLFLGLEKVSGQLRLDSVFIRKVGPVDAPARDSTLAIPPAWPVRLRGAMIGPSADTASIARFGNEWKGNLLRWQLGGSSYPDALLRPDFETLFSQETAKLDRALPICRENNIKVVVDMHSLSQGLFDSPKSQTLLMDVWQRLAERYHDSDAVWGYDLANEPIEEKWREGALLWNELADTLCRIIRKIDPIKPIIVEGTRWAAPDGLAEIRPVGWDRGYDLTNIVYSFHCYSPFTLTHQGIGAGYPPFGAVYPGTIDNVEWDSVRLRQELAPVVRFQQRYRVPIYVGEFSCVRWANDHSAIRWLTDFTSIIESYGWDWTYHAYQEYHGWSVEYSDSLGDMRTPLETDRKALLLSWFALNKNPYDTLSAPVSPRVPAVVHSFVRLVGNGTGEVKVMGLHAGMRVKLYNIRGNLVCLSASVSGKVLNLGRGLPAGVYCGFIESGGERECFKIVLVR